MTSPPKPERGPCEGQGCGLENVWPLHNVFHGGDLLRLCTSCVLKYHPGSFCTLCFDFLDGSQSPSSVIPCSGCPSLSHTTCLPLPSDSSLHERNHLCPTCASPNDFSYFSLSSGAIDLGSAKVLLVAARIASVSMNRAVSEYRTRAERKVKKALVKRRVAFEMYERASFAVEKEREREREREKEISDMGNKARGFKFSDPNAGLVAAQERFQRREREKLMKFQEPIALTKASAMGMEKKGILLAYQTNLVAREEKKGVLIGPTQTLTSPGKGNLNKI